MNDEIKLIHLRDPEPSTHFDERMHWTLRDVARLFPHRPQRQGQSAPRPGLGEFEQNKNMNSAQRRKINELIKQIEDDSGFTATKEAWQRRRGSTAAERLQDWINMKKPPAVVRERRG